MEENKLCCADWNDYYVFYQNDEGKIVSLHSITKQITETTMEDWLSTYIDENGNKIMKFVRKYEINKPYQRTYESLNQFLIDFNRSNLQLYQIGFNGLFCYSKYFNDSIAVTSVFQNCIKYENKIQCKKGYRKNFQIFDDLKDYKYKIGKCEAEYYEATYNSHLNYCEKGIYENCLAYDHKSFYAYIMASPE